MLLPDLLCTSLVNLFMQATCPYSQQDTTLNMYLYELDFLLPLELPPSGCHHFYESTQGLLRAHSVIDQTCTLS